MVDHAEKPRRKLSIKFGSCRAYTGVAGVEKLIASVGTLLCPVLNREQSPIYVYGKCQLAGGSLSISGDHLLSQSPSLPH